MGIQEGPGGRVSQQLNNIHACENLLALFITEVILIYKKISGIWK